MKKRKKPGRNAKWRASGDSSGAESPNGVTVRNVGTSGIAAAKNCCSRNKTSELGVTVEARWTSAADGTDGAGRADGEATKDGPLKKAK